MGLGGGKNLPVNHCFAISAQSEQQYVALSVFFLHLFALFLKFHLFAKRLVGGLANARQTLIFKSGAGLHKSATISLLIF